MKIQIRVAQEGAANYVEHEIDMERPAEEWTETDLFRLVGKMQHYIGGGDPALTRVGDGFTVTVTIAGRRAQTIGPPLRISDGLASSAIWSRKTSSGGSLRLIPVASIRSGQQYGTGRTVQYEVAGLPDGQKAWIWTGDYGTAEDALAALEAAIANGD
jgi:hypothetical protein